MKISENVDGVKISIPMRRMWPFTLFQSLAVCGVVSPGLWSAAHTQSWGIGDTLFVATWGVVLGVYLLCIWLWTLSSETIFCSHREFSHKLHFGPFAIDRKYDPEQLSDFRHFPPPATGQGTSARGVGKLCFDHNGNTQRFGMLMNEAEGELVLAALRRATS